MERIESARLEMLMNQHIRGTMRVDMGGQKPTHIGQPETNYTILTPKRVESTDGSASHPYRRVAGRFRRNRRDILPVSQCVWYYPR